MSIYKKLFYSVLTMLLSFTASKFAIGFECRGKLVGLCANVQTGSTTCGQYFVKASQDKGRYCEPHVNALGDTDCQLGFSIPECDLPVSLKTIPSKISIPSKLEPVAPRPAPAPTSGDSPYRRRGSFQERSLEELREALGLGD